MVSGFAVFGFRAPLVQRLASAQQPHTTWTSLLSQAFRSSPRWSGWLLNTEDADSLEEIPYVTRGHHLHHIMAFEGFRKDSEGRRSPYKTHIDRVNLGVASQPLNPSRQLRFIMFTGIFAGSIWFLASVASVLGERSSNFNRDGLPDQFAADDITVSLNVSDCPGTNLRTLLIFLLFVLAHW